MKKNENTYIKLGLEKDPHTGELQVFIQFDNNAPNFTKDKEITYWRPSCEEWNFAKDAFDLIWKGQDTKTKNTNYEHKDDFNDNFGSKPPLTERKFEDDQEVVDKILEKNKKP